MGSRFEYNNHNKNEKMLQAASSMTPNSGAGKIKGDEQISGVISIMEELKTKVKQQAPGKETFTIKKSWLDKLEKESNQENKEFWALKFSFFESDEKVYVILDQNLYMDMIATMVNDRIQANKADKSIEVSNTKARMYESKCIALESELNYYRKKEEFEQLDIKSNKSKKS